MKWDSATYRITDKGRTGAMALACGIIGLIAMAAGFFIDREQFFFSWLTAYAFWVTLALGGLFFVMLHHLVGATWSVVVRRLAEAIMMVLPFMVVFLIPVLFGLPYLFHWSHAEAVAADALLQVKAPFLNTGFFVVRAVVYFAVWTGLALMLRRVSLAQDNQHSETIARRMRIISAPGMILFAVTVTFASFDWLMSLDAHWYSTIFGVYVFSGAVVAVISYMIVVTLILRRQGLLTEVVTVEHYHDLGKLLFAFLVFWGYMAFSQYFLIWYGNIPEETIWYLHRWEGSWKTVSLVIVFGHFVVPFFILITRGAKRRLMMLFVLAIWMLAMHRIDLYWVIMPNYHSHGIHLSWMDPAAMLGIGGIFIHLFWSRFASHPLVPVGDPKLGASINFTNY